MTDEQQIKRFIAYYQVDTTWAIEERLKNAQENIKILESIYKKGGALNYFSDPFADAAHQERQRICLITSALHSILRTRAAAAI